MSTVLLRDDTILRLYPLSVGAAEDGLREVGRPETGVFIGLPEEGVLLLDLFRRGLPMRAVGAEFAEVFGTEPDLTDFVEGLLDCGFVAAVDGEPVDPPVEARPAAGWRVLAGLPAERVRWLLSRPLLLAYRAVWIAVPAVLLLRPDLAPRPGDALLTDRVLLNAVALTGLAWIMIFLHELAHLVAARARGAVGALSLGRRMYFLVAQTDMSAVRALPRRERYAPYLAGMTLELVVLLGCLLLRAAGVTTGPAAGLAGTLGYLVTVQLLFQFAIFLRTDLYYVLTNLLRTGNLAEDTTRVLGDLARRVTGGRRADLSGIPARERRIVRWYAPLYCLGFVAAVANLVGYVLPVLVTLVAHAGDGLVAGDALARAEAVAFLAVIGFNLGTVVVLAVRAHPVRLRPRRAVR